MRPVEDPVRILGKRIEDLYAEAERLDDEAERRPRVGFAKQYARRVPIPARSTRRALRS